MYINSKSEELDFELVALSDIPTAGLQHAVKYGTEETQLVNGKPVYRMPDIFAKQSGRKVPVSVKVFERPTTDIPELTRVRLKGSAVITPYIQGNRVALSITADGIEVVK